MKLIKSCIGPSRVASTMASLAKSGRVAVRLVVPDGSDRQDADFPFGLGELSSRDGEPLIRMEAMCSEKEADGVFDILWGAARDTEETGALVVVTSV